jgi:ABC-type dipeptide/oligopeptide/nickel transport system ATPase component
MHKKQSNCILDVKDLHVEFRTDLGTVSAVNGVDFHVRQGDSIAIVGESGCGKSVTAYSILRILPRSARIPAGQINFRKRDGIVQDRDA